MNTVSTSTISAPKTPSSQDLDLAQILWDYHALETPLESSDVLLVFGSNDLRVAERAVEIFQANLVPKIIISGNVGRSSQNSNFGQAEAEVLAQAMTDQGIPTNKIILEKEATNTGENIDFSLKLMQKLGLNWQKFILLQAPYMQRRAYSAFCKTQPDRSAFSTTVRTPFLEYPYGEEITFTHLIEMLVADTQRLELYFAKGFLIKNDIPPEVWAAYEKLCAAGYDKYII